MADVPFFLDPTAPWSVFQDDAIRFMNNLPGCYVDLVLCSPPYTTCRTYEEGGPDPGISRGTEDWVAWMVDVVQAAVRVTLGLAMFVVGVGATSDYRWSAAPALLAADLVRKGVHLRAPLLYRRIGTPGSGGPDYLRSDYEWILVAQNGEGRLPWANNVATGHLPRWEDGGLIRTRRRDGSRQFKQWKQPEFANGGNPLTKDYDGQEVADLLEAYERSDVRDCLVGGNHMGHPLAYRNEAPYPLSLVEPLVLTFCPPGGLVLDPFCGSGTTLEAAVINRRRAIGVDIRPSQVELTRKRMLSGITPKFWVEEDERYKELPRKKPRAGGD